MIDPERSYEACAIRCAGRRRRPARSDPIYVSCPNEWRAARIGEDRAGSFQLRCTISHGGLCDGSSAIDEQSLPGDMGLRMRRRPSHCSSAAALAPGSCFGAFLPSVVPPPVPSVRFDRGYNRSWWTPTLAGRPRRHEGAAKCPLLWDRMVRCVCNRRLLRRWSRGSALCRLLVEFTVATNRHRPVVRRRS